MRILVVDDNRDGADSLAALLRHWGHQVQAAYNGESAVTTVREFMPQVVLLDIHMPDLNGGKVAVRLRQKTASAQIIILAVTAFEPDDKQFTRYAASFDGYIAKPFDLKLLESMFSEGNRPVAGPPIQQANCFSSDSLPSTASP